MDFCFGANMRTQRDLRRRYVRAKTKDHEFGDALLRRAVPRLKKCSTPCAEATCRADGTSRCLARMDAKTDGENSGRRSAMNSAKFHGLVRPGEVAADLLSTAQRKSMSE